MTGFRRIMTHGTRRRHRRATSRACSSVPSSGPGEGGNGVGDGGRIPPTFLFAGTDTSGVVGIGVVERRPPRHVPKPAVVLMGPAGRQRLRWTPERTGPVRHPFPVRGPQDTRPRAPRRMDPVPFHELPRAPLGAGLHHPAQVHRGSLWLDLADRPGGRGNRAPALASRSPDTADLLPTGHASRRPSSGDRRGTRPTPRRGTR